MATHRWAAAQCAALLTFCMRATAAVHDDLSEMDLATLMRMDVTLVTAQRRTEDVNTVPIAMTVLKLDGVSGAPLDSTRELQTVVSGLTTASTAGFMLPYIRGVGTDINASIEPSISVYVDGVYQASRQQTFVDLADAAQIDVLKGPQGTLYGRNATGGAIEVTTLGPTQHLTASAQVSTGSFDLRDVSAFLAGPLHERVRASIAVHAREKDALYENILRLPQPPSEDFHTLHGRLQVDLTSTLDAEVLFKHLSRDDSVNAGTEVSGNSLPALLGIPVATQPFTSASELTDVGNRVVDTSTALKLNWSAPLVRVSSVTAYDELDQRVVLDMDASAARLLELSLRTPGHTFTQELQLTPLRAPDGFDWLAGAFYIHDSGGFMPLDMAIAMPALPPLALLTYGRVHTEAYAAFGEATVWLDRHFSLTGGLRYSSEHKRLVDAAVGLRGAPLLELPERDESWQNVNYRLVAKYSFDYSLLYAKTETGFKSGAYNNINPLDPGPIDPEHITAYEIGVKHGFANVPVHLTAAAFLNDYRDLQLQLTDDQAFATVFTQAPRAKTYGIDVGIDFKAGRYWDFNGTMTWLEAKYDDFVADGVLVANPMGGHIGATDFDLSGNRLSRSPRFTAQLTAAFDYPVGTGSIFGGANYYHSSRMYFDLANGYARDPVGILNARIGYRAQAGWHISAWAKNLTDETYLSTVLPIFSGALGQYAEPRMLGVTMGFSFGR